MTEYLYPITVRLQGRPVVVVGAGRIAADKAAGLLVCGAVVTVIAPDAAAELAALAEAGRIRWLQRTFEPSDLDGATLVVAATEKPDVNQQVVDAAHDRNLLVNAVDDPQRCDYHVPAIVRRGPLTIAISTGGASPAAAARLRREIEDVVGEGTGEWLQLLAAFRADLLRTFAGDPDTRRVLALEAARCEARQLAEAGEVEAARHVLDELLTRNAANRGQR